MKGRVTLVSLALVVAAQVWAGDDPFAFMPDGGRGAFLRAFPDAGAQRDALSQSRNVQAWQAVLANSKLGAREIATLASYLARVAPRPVETLPVETLPVEELRLASLPPDGRDLALAQCQSCHSLFSGYLMQRRDRTGWLMIFASPFHKDIPMTQTEREIFADYSAINMPMRVEDVPPEMRF
jgi:hypothetical protein